MKGEIMVELMKLEDRARSLRNYMRRRGSSEASEIAELADIVTQLTQTVRGGLDDERR